MTNSSNTSSNQDQDLTFQFIPPIGLLVSAIPGNGQDFRNPEPESDDKIRAIREVRENIRKSQLPLITVANRSQDILPANSLKAGAARSQAVCRIAQYFSLEGFKNYILEIKKNLEQQPGNPNFDSCNKIKEIFLIPEELSQDLFRKPESPLDALLNITVDQLAQINPVARGTGFLVGGTHLLTNHHVIPDEATAAQCVAQFNYTEDELGNLQKSVDYEFEPETLFITEPSLDYTLIQLESSLSQKPAGYEFGWIQLVEDDEVVLPGDNVMIIHHPKGWVKKLDITNNFVIENTEQNQYKCAGLFKDVLRYTADTDYGSSGSPVFNTDWQLVALHHAVIPIKEMLKEGSTKIDDDPNWIQQGIRICRIIEDLKVRNTVNPRLKTFIENFVATSEQLNYPPIFTGIKFNGLSDHVVIDSKVAFASSLSTDNDSEVDIKRGFSTIKLWNSSGIELKSLNHQGCEEILFSSDCKRLASSQVSLYDNPQIKIWDLENDILINTLPQDETEKELLRRNGDSLLDFQSPIIVIGNKFFNLKVSLWDVDNGNLLNGKEKYAEFIDVTSTGVKFSPKGDILAVVRENVVELWNTDTWTVFSKTKYMEGKIHNICFNTDGSSIAVYFASKFIYIFNVKNLSEPEVKFENFNISNREEFRYVYGNDKSEKLIFINRDSTDGYRAVLLSLTGEIIEQVNFETYSVDEGFGSYKSEVAISRDGTMYLYLYNGRVFLCNLNNGEIIKQFKHLNLSLRSDYDFLQRRVISGLYTKVAFSPDFSYQDLIGYQPTKFTQEITGEAWISPDLALEGTIFDFGLDLPEGGTGSLSVKISAKRKTYVILYIDLKRLGVALQGNYSSDLVDRRFIPISLSKLLHIAVIVKPNLESNKTVIEIYVNGKRLDHYDLDHYDIKFCFPYLRLIGSFLYNNNSEITLQDFFKGNIYEVRVWGTAKTEDEIRENMYRRLIGNEEGLIDYWRFEESQGDRIYNLASKPENVNNYSIVRGAKRLTASQINGFSFPCGLKFTEENDHVDCGGDKSLNIDQEITIEAWVKHRFGNCLIVHRGQYSQTVYGGKPRYVGYFLVWHNGKIRVILQNENPTQKIIVETREKAPQDLLWHHVAFTWDSTSSVISIYIDGRLQDSVIIEGQSKTITSAGKRQTYGIFEGSFNNLTSPLKIGCREKQEAYYNVMISDVRLWNVSRPQDQIKGDMNQRLKGKEEGLIGYWRLDDGGENNRVARNLVSDKNHGEIKGTTSWFPAPPKFED